MYICVTKVIMFHMKNFGLSQWFSNWRSCSFSEALLKIQAHHDNRCRAMWRSSKLVFSTWEKTARFSSKLRWAQVLQGTQTMSVCPFQGDGRGRWYQVTYDLWWPPKGFQGKKCSKILNSPASMSDSGIPWRSPIQILSRADPAQPCLGTCRNLHNKCSCVPDLPNLCRKDSLRTEVENYCTDTLVALASASLWYTQQWTQPRKNSHLCISTH